MNARKNELKNSYGDIPEISLEEQKQELDSYIFDYCQKIAIKTGFVLGVPTSVYLLQNSNNHNSDNFTRFLKFFNTFILLALTANVGVTEIKQDIQTLRFLVLERIKITRSTK